MAVMAMVPRHEFVRSADRDLAYDNCPLQIGYGQTISQPFIVAVTTDLAEPARGCRALEVGTGSGYQAAVLAELCDKVYTIDIVEPVGTRFTTQQLVLVHKRADGRVTTRQMLPVSFVPLTGGHD